MVRLKIPHWQNALVQVLAQFVFWVAFIWGINLGLRSAVVGGMLGAIIAAFIAPIPGIYCELKVK
jgi:ABC-type phosphate/phosphonate transport system permease subunit